MAKISKKISWEIAKKIFLPFIIFIVFLSGYLFYRLKLSFYLSPELQEEISRHSLAFFILIIGFSLQRITSGALAWYKKNIAPKTKTRLDDELLPFLKRILNIIIWVIVFLVILPLYGVNITALIAALGVGSLAIALAAQDTIANIIAGFMIMLDAPFRIGDRIKLPSGETVDVLDIGIRRSKFLSQDQAIIIMPNLELSKSKIVNYSYAEQWKIKKSSNY